MNKKKKKKRLYKTNYSLKKEFPILYDYLYNEISDFYDSLIFTKRKKNIPPVFIVISFFMIFEKNYMKCLYIIEKIN